MPNRRSRRSGGKGGVPNTETFPPTQLSGGSKDLSSYALPEVKHIAADGSVMVTFPTFEPLFTFRPKVTQIEWSNTNIGSFLTANTGTPTFLTNPTINMNDISFGVMVDNIAKAYANAQLLQLTALVDYRNYINNYLSTLGSVMALVSILNGDGFNEVVSQLAQKLVTFRSRIQTVMDRLQLIPIPPGILDFCTRTFGLFAAYAGGDCILSTLMTVGSTGVPLDLNVLANINTYLTTCESSLLTLESTAESGTIRIVLSEYFGDPAPLPFPGVRIARPLYDQFYVMGMYNLATTNVFGVPYLAPNATSVIAENTVPVLIPRGAEQEVWWTTLWRAQPFVSYNNVAKALADTAGLVTLNPANQITVRQYPVNNGAEGTFTNTTATDGWSSAMPEFYWAPPSGASNAAPYGVDIRTQRDFLLFEVPVTQIINQTVAMTKRIMINKERFPYSSYVQEWSTQRVRGNRGV